MYMIDGNDFAHYFQTLHDQSRLLSNYFQALEARDFNRANIVLDEIGTYVRDRSEGFSLGLVKWVSDEIKVLSMFQESLEGADTPIKIQHLKALLELIRSEGDEEFIDD